MRVRFTASLLAIFTPLSFVTTAMAAPLPPIISTSSNQVPECVTPGRLHAFLKSRNSRLPSKYDKITADYMRHGNDLGIRWDYGFFQMMVETATLSYTGDVRAKQNNFAGLGATGGGERGESFSSVSDGVRAHLEHVLMYSGKRIENPVAERTRKVQAWGVLNKWRKSIRGPMTFKHLTRKWAPPDRGYARDIDAIAQLFFKNHCNQPDPNPGLLAAAGGGRGQQPSIKTTKTTSVQTKPSALGASTTETSKKTKAATAPAAKDKKDRGAARFSAGARGASSVKVAVLNAPKKDQIAPATGGATPPDAKAGTTSKPGATAKSKPGTGSKTAVKKPQSGRAAGAAGVKKPSTADCKVWTASYGGSKALIIKAVKKGVTNYTVLDVNAGREKSEASAYIKAYAKGGSTVGTYTSPEKALKQAFQLCPEG